MNLLCVNVAMLLIHIPQATNCTDRCILNAGVFNGFEKEIESTWLQVAFRWEFYALHFVANTLAVVTDCLNAIAVFEYRSGTFYSLLESYVILIDELL